MKTNAITKLLKKINKYTIKPLILLFIFPILIVVTIITLLISAIKENTISPTKETQIIEKLLKLSDNDYITIQIINTKTNKTSMINLEVARSEKKRQTGLMFRENLKDSEGMIFIFDNKSYQKFWMKNTFIPLDIIFLDNNLNIVNFYESMEPNNEQKIYTSQKPVQIVIELKSNSIKNLDINKNTKFNILNI